jgi:aminoglycoside/choline kinase family phosphotransferase
VTDARAPVVAFDGMQLDALLTALWGLLPADVRVEKLRGEASLRSYYRVETSLATPARAIVMRLPDSGPGGYVPGETFGFTNVQAYLRRLALPVPEIYVDRKEAGLLALEDLGEQTFAARLAATARSAWRTLYDSAVSLLAALHERTEEPDPRCVAFSRSFDAKLLGWELDHFREWGLEALGHTLSATERALFDAQKELLVASLLALPQGFAHRDYQSRNLMWARPDHLVLIDFQDALMGPFVYDLVALLCDSYVALDAELQEHAIRRYARLRGFPYEAVRQAFDLCAVQRKLKDTGRFVFIDRVRKNPDFLPAFAPSLRYVERALQGVPALQPLRTLIANKLPGYPDHVATPASVNI